MAEEAAGRMEQFTQQLADAGQRINPILEEVLPPQGVEFLSQPVWYHLQSGGKRVRPAMCLLSCEHLGGDPDRALYFAAAVEILHNMLLIHDDLEDGDRVRRNQQTVWLKYGIDNAVNVGDYMLGVAYRAVLKSPVADPTQVRLAAVFTDAYVTTCRGQALDMNWRGREDIGVGEYLEMVTLKTGHYLALGLLGGGIIAGVGEQVLASLESLAENMGAAFQIRDDTIDLTTGKGRAGQVGNDVREGKASILYAHALSAATPEQRAELAGIMRKPREETTKDDVLRVRELYEELGSIEFARSEADRLARQAFKEIETMPVEEKEFFRQLARYVGQRNR